MPGAAAGAVHLWTAVSLYVLGGWLGGRYPSPWSSHLSQLLLAVDINKNTQLTTKQQGPSVEKETRFLMVVSEGLMRQCFDVLCDYARTLKNTLKNLSIWTFISVKLLVGSHVSVNVAVINFHLPCIVMQGKTYLHLTLLHACLVKPCSGDYSESRPDAPQALTLQLMSHNTNM